VEDVAGRGLVTPVSENEPIMESKLAPVDAGAGLAPAIPSGLRAISVKVNEVIGVAGFAVPGARVDVVATVRHPNDSVARILVANVPILTAGTRYDQERGREVKPIPSTVVTLVVTPTQAERIALAQTEGQITLMLRNPIDVAEPLTPGARLARLVDETAIVPPSSASPAAPKHPRPSTRLAADLESPPAVPKTAPTALYTVEAIRAGKRTQEIVQ
jgi:pilus assembly protein CpaB